MKRALFVIVVLIATTLPIEDALCRSTTARERKDETTIVEARQTRLPFAGCPTDYATFAGVSDHQGITFGSCSGEGFSKYCTYTQPITCSTTAGSRIYTVSGYQPTIADVGKHLIIGMPYKINGSTSTTGAGGSSYPGQPLRVVIDSVNGHSIIGATFPGGSVSAAAANTVTEAQCDLGTDNGVLLQELVDSLSTDAKVCIPPGAYQMETGATVHNKNISFYCLPGAIFYDARNDAYQKDFIKEKMFDFLNSTAGGIDGCTYVGTNTGINWRSGFEPNTNQPYFTEDVSGLHFQNLTSLLIWGDADVELSTSPSLIGSSHNTVQQNYSQGGWAYGPSVIVGNYNTFNDNIMRNLCHDLEPNNEAEASVTHHNVFSNFYCQNDGRFAGGSSAGTMSVGGDTHFCNTSKLCASTETVGPGRVRGNIAIVRGCYNGSPSGFYSGVVSSGNDTGSPSCNCDSHCW